MSLLLDALKRAEQAKRGDEESPEAPTLDALSFDQTPLPPPDDAAPPHVLITRDRLPDISQSLEILADDLPPPLLRRSAKDRRNEPGLGASLKEDALAAQAQAAARRLFEAKHPPSNPKLPFYITCGVLGVIAILGIGYVWYQLQPRTPATIATASNPPAAMPLPSSPSTISAPAYAPQPVGETIVPPLATGTTDRIVTMQRAPGTVVAQAEPPATPRSMERIPTPRAVTAGPSFNKSVAVGPSLTEQAYAAFERGDLAAARDQYQAALAQDPLNRDALLGLATLDVRSGRYESAEARYLKTLEADPRNAHAQAGLIALRGQTDPVASESRLKNLLAQQPNAGFLNFALGNQYAAQARWSDAQQAYFKAYVAEPGNADFAFNLAVSLDQMRQSRAAVDYYQKALTLDAAQRGNFNRAQVETRLRELQQTP